MKTEDENKFKTLLYALAEEYQQEFSSERTKLWWEQLKDFDYQAVANAVAICMRTCKFFPRLADIFAVLKPVKKAHAHEAWQNLLINLSGSSAGDDEITQQVVRLMGGARKLAMMDEKDLRFKEKTFIELYEEITQEKEHNHRHIEFTSHEKINDNPFLISKIIDISKEIH